MESSLCRKASASPIEFGHNLMTGCLITLSKSDFADCDALSENLMMIYNSLINSDNSLAKGGNPNITDINDFVSFIMDEEDDFFDNTTDDSNSLNIPTCKVPSFLQLKITYSKAKVLSRDPIYRINAARLHYHQRNWFWICKEDFKEACTRFQNFEIKMMIAFEEIPLIWHYQNTSR